MVRRLLVVVAACLWTVSAGAADEARRVEVNLDGDGRLVSIVHGLTGRVSVKPPQPLIPFGLGVRDENHIRREKKRYQDYLNARAEARRLGKRPPAYRKPDDWLVTLDDADVQLDDHRTTTERGRPIEVLRYVLPKHNVSVECRIAYLDEATTRWTLEVTNNGPLDIRRIDWPRLPGVRIGPSVDDDEIVFPRRIAQREKVLSGHPRRGLYGGGLSMGWMDQFDATGGLYVAEVNPDLVIFGLEAMQNRRDKCSDMVVKKYAWVPRGRSARSIAEVGCHTGDWHWAADRYRRWYYKHYEPARYPAWMARAQGMLQLPLMHNNQDAWTTFDRRLRWQWDRARLYGCDFIGGWGQMGDGAACGLYPYPNVRMGGPEAMKKGLQYVRDNGGHAFFYINHYRLSKDYGKDPNIGNVMKSALPTGLEYGSENEVLEAALTDIAGEPIECGGTHYAKYQRMYRMDYNHRFWREHMSRWVKFYNDLGGYIYLDENGVGAHLSYGGGDRLFEGHGQYNRAYLQWLKQITAECRRTDPDFTFGGEACLETFNHYVGWQMDQGFGDYVEAFRYTHPEAGILRWHRSPPTTWPFVDKARLAFVNGTQILVTGQSMAEVLTLRRRIADLVTYADGAVFRDEDGLTVRVDGQVRSTAGYDLKVRRFDTNTVSRKVSCITWYNRAGLKPVEVTVNTSGLGRVNHVLLYTIKEGMTSITDRATVTDGSVTFTLPQEQIGAVALVVKETPEKSLRAYMEVDDAWEHNAVRLVMANVGDGPLSLDPEWVQLGALQMAHMKIMQPPLQPGGVTAVSYMPKPRRADIVYDVVYDIIYRTNKDKGFRHTLRTVCADPVPNASLEVDQLGDSIPDYWAGAVVIDRDVKAQGKGSARLDWSARLPQPGKCHYTDEGKLVQYTLPKPGEGFIAAGVPMYLKADTDYRIKLKLKCNRYVEGSKLWVRVAVIGPSYALHKEQRFSITEDKDGWLHDPAKNQYLTKVVLTPEQHDGAWHEVSADFTTKIGQFEYASLYVIQQGSPEPVWIDDIQLQAR